MENIDITLQEPSISNVDSVLSGPQGPKGDPGEPGRDGVSPTVNVGEVTTLNSGQLATVTNVGSDSNVILNFGIPQGPQGIQGVPGVHGADGVDGVSPTITVGSTYTLQPDQPATVENVGSDNEVILNFGIPQGRQGDTSGCLSVPTIVNDFPATANPATFYFLEREYTETTVTGDNLTLTIGDNAGRISTLSIHGYLNSSLEPLTGNIDITVDGNTTTVPLDSTFLAEVNGTYDEIINDGIKWYLTKRIGYIESYDGETITTDYVSTSGTLTVGDEVYYVLEDENTAEIENASITSPLNAIRTYNYQTGTVTITTSANVTANLEISYHTIDINNQYDKYVYMIDTANWEVIGGGDSTIPDGSITTAKLADSSVTTVKIADSNITTAKIADNNITTAKIADDSITSNKIDWTTIKYSTSEEQPIGVWIDGKTIYRKVVNFGALPNTSVKQVPSGVTNMEFLVSMTALAYNGSGTYLSIPYTHQDQLPLQIQFAYTNNHVQISTGTDRSSYSAYVILEYTKTS